MQSGMIKRILVVSVIICLIASYFIFDFDQYFSLEYIKASREQFQALYAEHTFTVIAVYFGVYVAATAWPFLQQPF